MFFLIARQARSNDPSTRMRAAEKLGSGGRAASSGGMLSKPVALLLELASDKDTGVRAAAIESLGRVADGAAVPGLIAALKDVDKLPDPGGTSIREAATTALRAIGVQAVPSLVTLSKDRNARLREIAVGALGGISGAEAEAALVAALQDSRSSVRQAAVRGLATGAASGTIGSLSAALNHKDPATRKTAIEALGGLEGAEVVQALRGLTRDADRTVREAAVRALSGQRSASSIEALLDVFDGPDRELRQLAAAALKGRDWEPATPAQRALRAILRGEYAAAAAEGGAAIEPLSALLGDKSPEVRTRAAEALGRTGDALAVAPLVRALQDGDAKVAHAAAAALILLGAAAVPFLVCAVHEAVRAAAPAIVLAIGPAAASPLLEVLERGEPYRHGEAPEGGPHEVTRIAEDTEVEQAQTAARLLGRLMQDAGAAFDRPTAARIGRLRDIVRVREVMPANRRELPTVVVDTVVNCADLRNRGRLTE